MYSDDQLYTGTPLTEYTQCTIMLLLNNAPYARNLSVH